MNVSFVRPMKARPYDESRDNDAMRDNSRYWAEMKEDGFRSLASRDVVWSSLGNPRKLQFVQDILPSNVLVDSEVAGIDPKERSHDVARHLSEDHDKLKFIAFDLLYLDGWILDKPLWERRRLLEEVMEPLLVEDRIEVSRVITVDKQQFLDRALDDEREGIMLKDRLSIYKPNSRAKWIKRKATRTYDVVIVDMDGEVTAESSKEKGYKNLRYGWFSENGDLRVIGSLGKTGTPEKLEKFIGMVCEVKSFGECYPTGALRHPQVERFRDDKAAEECIFVFSAGKPIEECV